MTRNRLVATAVVLLVGGLVFLTILFSVGVSHEGTENGKYYPMEVTAVDGNGHTVTKTVMVWVYDDECIAEYKALEAVMAADVTLEAKGFSGLGDTELIELSGAHAWRTDTDVAIPITTVTKKPLDAVNGRYQVTFMTACGTAKTVYFYEYRDKIMPVDTLMINTVDFFAFGSNAFVILLFIFFLIIFPFIILLIQYWIVRNKRKKVEALLYNDSELE